MYTAPRPLLYFLVTILPSSSYHPFSFYWIITISIQRCFCFSDFRAKPFFFLSLFFQCYRPFLASFGSETPQNSCPYFPPPVLLLKSLKIAWAGTLPTPLPATEALLFSHQGSPHRRIQRSLTTRSLTLVTWLGSSPAWRQMSLSSSSCIFFSRLPGEHIHLIPSPVPQRHLPHFFCYFFLFSQCSPYWRVPRLSSWSSSLPSLHLLPGASPIHLNSPPGPLLSSGLVMNTQWHNLYLCLDV